MKNTDKNRNTHPPYIYPAYTSTIFRGPTKALIPVKESLSELTTPVFGNDRIGPLDHDLTRNGIKQGEPIGERIVVSGKITDELGRPIRNSLVEIWQANAAGRYIHKVDQHNAPLDPNFFGGGRCLTDDNGRYKFYTIKPGAYPWQNHANAWRPNHIHFSVFGSHITSRLITQMYFPGDPLLMHDPIYNSIPAQYRQLLISDFNLGLTEEGFALGYEFNIVLSGREQTPFE